MKSKNKIEHSAFDFIPKDEKSCQILIERARKMAENILGASIQ